MNDISCDTRLIAEHYDVHPQGIVWMRPLFSSDGKQITDFEFTYSNDEGLNYLNLTREQFSRLLLSNTPTITDEFRKVVLAEMATVYRSGEKSETTVFNPVLNKYARVLRSKLHDGVLTVVQDITKETQTIHQLEKQAQQLEEQTRQLQEQKTLLDNILKNSSNGISVSEVFRDENGKVIDALTIMANDAAIKYIGFPKEIYLTKRATEIEPAVIGSPYYQACIKTLETGEPFVMQYQVQATGKWLELTVSKLDYNHLIQVFTDVTPIKEAQLQLEKGASTLKTVFDAAQTGLFTLAPEYNDRDEIVDFRFLMANSTVSAFIGKTPQELEGERVSKWFPGYQTNGLFEMYKHTFQTGEPQRRETHYNVDGFDNYLDLQSVNIGQQILVSFTDHTSVRKSQLKLEQTVKALERSNAYLEDFAYAASHDLKEPIRKILTFASRLKTTLVARMTESEAGLFKRIDTSAKRMQLLVDDLLEFSQVSEQPRQIEPVDLNQKIQTVLSDLELEIEEKQASIIIKNKLPTIEGNRRQLQQLFQNLIGNALKYSKAEVPPVITICADLIETNDALTNRFPIDTPYYLISITDNGIGFEPTHAEKIFEMFKRLHGKAEYSGTGIGLSIARKVVENHNGFIWAESEPGRGAVFNILFPANLTVQ